MQSTYVFDTSSNDLVWHFGVEDLELVQEFVVMNVVPS